MDRKGIATSTIAVLAGLFIFANIMFALWTNSPIRDLIDQGADEIAENTQYTIQIGGKGVNEEESKQKLSDLAMFVYQRASNDGCKEEGSGLTGPTVWKQNNNRIGKWINGVPGQEGYPGLKDTYLTRFPKCYGASDSNLRNAGPQELGQDMEGIYSREKFEIKKQRIILKAGNSGSGSGGLLSGGGSSAEEDRGDTWLEKNLIFASKQGYQAKSTGCQSSSKLIGTRQNFIVFFQADVATGGSGTRAQPWYEDMSPVPSDSPYCDAVLDITGNYMAKGPDKQSSVVLCPGDKGYIQMNKGSPDNEGEAGETGTVDWLASNGFDFVESTPGEANKYPHIVITDVEQKSCSKGAPELKEVSVDREENYDIDPDDLVADVVLRNGRLSETDFTIEMVSGGSTVKSRSVTMASNSQDTFEIRKNDINSLDCEVTVRVTEEGGSWSDSRDKFTHSLRDDCGEPATDAEIVNIDVSKNSGLLGSSVKFEFEVSNHGVTEGEFRAYVYESGAVTSGSLSADTEFITRTGGYLWTNIRTGKTKTLTTKEGSLTDGDICNVDVVLWEQNLDDPMFTKASVSLSDAVSSC